ncbi:unnamed protein product [marine sediment metagenome]|uniref:Penicillinase repressor n=1 Tax=marine sediment metagenome TaxID=412755 RepID=X1FRB1_9ZZZZ
MARRKARTLTEVELEFMRVIWAAPEDVTSKDVQKALGRELSDGSIRKVLSILGDKGYVSRKKDGRFFHYRAEVPEEQAHRSLVADLRRRAFGGSAALMVATLLDSRSVGKKDIRKIKKLIAELEREKRS